MQYDLEVFLVQVSNHRRGIRKCAVIEDKRSVARVPARRTKSSAEVDEGVTRELLLAKRLGLRQHFFAARQRAMGLLITQSPDRRQVWKSCQPRVFRQKVRRVFGYDQEDVQREGSLQGPGRKAAVFADQVKASKRLMEKQRPPLSADQPGDRHPRAVDGHVVDALAALHGIGDAATVELRPAFAQPEDGTLPARETDRTILL